MKDNLPLVCPTCLQEKLVIGGHGTPTNYRTESLRQRINVIVYCTNRSCLFDGYVPFDLVIGEDSLLIENNSIWDKVVSTEFET